MKKTSIYFFAFLFAFIFSLNVNSAKAQENEDGEATEETGSPIFLSADLVSRYVWRGQQLGPASLQPLMGIEKNGFQFGSFSSISLMKSDYVQEFDFFAQYTIKEAVSVIVYDYFFPVDGARNNYFYYGDTTTHVFEATVSFNGTEKIPFSFLVATNFYGGDVKKANDKINYTTYAELGYSKDFNSTSLSAFLGASLNSPGDEIINPWYGNSKPAIINVGLKVSRELNISDNFKMPVYGSIVSNPEAGNMWFLFGLSIGTN